MPRPAYVRAAGGPIRQITACASRPRRPRRCATCPAGHDPRNTPCLSTSRTAWHTHIGTPSSSPCSMARSTSFIRISRVAPKSNVRGNTASGKMCVVAKLRPVPLLRICSMASAGMPDLAGHRHRLRRGDEGDGTEQVIGELHGLRGARPIAGNDDRLAPHLEHRHQIGDCCRIPGHHHGQRTGLGAHDAARDRGVDDGDTGSRAFRLDLANERPAHRAGVDQRLQGLPRQQTVGSGKRAPKNLERRQRDNDRVANVRQFLR